MFISPMRKLSAMSLTPKGKCFLLLAFILTGGLFQTTLAQTSVSLSNAFNTVGLVTDGTTFPNAGLDGANGSAGAIGDTAVSTSARSFFAQTFGQTMIADLIAQGITGVKGYTDEPLLQGISSPTIVLERFTRGFNLAQSFYAGSHFVGWTDVVLGDPLCHPYHQQSPISTVAQPATP
jgi:hypothetical protein